MGCEWWVIWRCLGHWRPRAHASLPIITITVRVMSYLDMPFGLWLGTFCSEMVHHSAVRSINVGTWKKQIWLLLWHWVKNVFPCLLTYSMLRDLISSSYLKDMLLYKVVSLVLIEQGLYKITYGKTFLAVEIIELVSQWLSETNM